MKYFRYERFTVHDIIQPLIRTCRQLRVFESGTVMVVIPAGLQLRSGVREQRVNNNIIYLLLSLVRRRNQQLHVQVGHTCNEDSGVSLQAHGQYTGLHNNKSRNLTNILLMNMMHTRPNITSSIYMYKCYTIIIIIILCFRGAHCNA